jgi:LacI family transcriptional regulator
MSTDPATVHDVARHAGVSIATVSRVVRGVGQVSAETRRKVLEAIDELQYRPNYLGRALVQRRHGALGIIFPGLSGPYYSEVIHGFETEAIAARMSVLILGTHLLARSDELAVELSGRVDGVAILGGTIGDAAVRQISDNGVCVVLLGRQALTGIPTVRVDNRQSTIALTLHLLRDHGYQHLAFIGDPTNSPDTIERWQGFVEAHHTAGVEPPDAPVRVGFEPIDGLTAAGRLLDGDNVPRAFVCANDEIALGAAAAAAARRINIPKQLAITGWDDIAMAGLVVPPLTTVRQPIRELGTRCAQLLLGRIHGEAALPTDTVLPTEPVIRASCGCTHRKRHRNAAVGVERR